MFVAYLFAAAGLGVVAMRGWAAGRLRLALGATFGYAMLFPLPALLLLMIFWWNLITN